MINVRNDNSVIPTSTPMMIAASMKKAVARSLTSASLRRRSMPSGVISWRTRSRGQGGWPAGAAVSAVLIASSVRGR